VIDHLLQIADAWWPWLAMLAGVLLAALANGIETGLYRLNRIRLRLRAEAGDRRASILLTLLGDLRGMIIVCLISTNAGQFLATAVATMLVAGSGWVGTSSGVELLTTLILTPLLFVFADVAPKSIFTAEADHWLYPMARPLRAAYLLLKKTGVVPALNGLSNLVLRAVKRAGVEAAEPFTPRQRLRALLSESHTEGVITGYQHELVHRVLGLRERLVRDVMIPMNRVAGVPVGITRPAFIEELRRHSFSRLPVWDGRRENIVGIVHINDVLAAQGDAMDLATLMHREIVIVPPDMPVGQAMFRLRQSRAAMAIVRDERGRAIGILTIKDLVEEVVGELAAW
jgi:CBS domain containing-hemolysin-like protein